jgi:hypothetical protein
MSNETFVNTKKWSLKKYLKRIMVAIGCILVLYLGVVPWLSSDLHMSSVTNDESEFVLDKANVLDVVSMVTDFDPSIRRLSYEMALFPRRDSTIGLMVGSNALIAEGKDFGLLVDNMGEDVFHEYRGLTIQGPISGSISVEPFANHNLSTYPFDAYVGKIFMKAKFVSEWTNEGPVEIKSPAPQLIHQYEYGVSPPSGYSVAFVRMSRESILDSDADAFNMVEIQDDISKGFFNSGVMVERSNITKFIAILLVLLFVLLAGSSLALYLAVQFGHRPPSQSALIWSNSIIFTIIAARFSFPQDPPIGILLDKMFLFPSLLIASACSIGLVWEWITKENYVSR